ncbi:WD40-repeat-containing domain protein [Geopyxis carbonaria]|nr:WD40-repeat-containing domain protein [Geopyxis carbonaria]
MPLHGLKTHSRSHSHTGTPDPPQHTPLASLAQASQAFAGIGNPAAATSAQLVGHPQPQSSSSSSVPNLNPNPNPNAGLRVQTSNSGLNFQGGIDSNNNSGITPIYSGGSSLAFSAGPQSSTDPIPPKKSIAFQLPSPNPSHQHHLHHQQQQQQQQQQQSDLFHSPQDLHPPPAHHSIPTQQQQKRASDSHIKIEPPSIPSSNSQPSYAAYHSSNPSSATGSRPQIAATATAPAAVPQAQRRSTMQRNTTGETGVPAGGSGYSPNSGAGVDSGSSSKKYSHPGALTPTYPTSSQHSSSHSHGGAGSSHLGMGLSGLTSSSNSMRERDPEPVGGLGAVGPGRWMSPYGLYALDWCKWPTTSGNGYGRIAVGSYSEDSHNYIQVLDTRPAQPDPQQPNAPPALEFTKLAEAQHTYPITRVLWEPPSSKPVTDLLATSGDHLRLWSLPSPSTSASPSNSITSRNYQAPISKLTPLALLSNSKSTDFTAPLTSLDWNAVSPSLIITSSIDTTCTIWDIPTLTAKTQLIAHDKEVFDVRFMSNSVDVFASCGADGSVRMFDLRSLEHSTIIYEPGASKSTPSNSGSASGDRESNSPVNTGTPPALLRLAASPHDQHLIATFCTDSPVVRILDVRQPGQALVELKGHQAAVNCCEWNPGRRGVLAAGGDDCEVLVWDIFAQTSGGTSSSGLKIEKGVEQERTPVAHWACEVEVANLSWSASQGKSGSDWLGVVGGRGVYGLGV